MFKIWGKHEPNVHLIGLIGEVVGFYSKYNGK